MIVNYEKKYGAPAYEKTYSAETEVDARGYVTKLNVGYMDDEIVAAHIVGIKVDFDVDKVYGPNKNHCVKYNEDMKAESGITWSEAATQLEIDIVSRGEVERVKGARYLSEDIKGLLQEIKDRKKEYDNNVLVK